MYNICRRTTLISISLLVLYVNRTVIICFPELYVNHTLIIIYYTALYVNRTVIICFAELYVNHTLIIINYTVLYVNHTLIIIYYTVLYVCHTFSFSYTGVGQSTSSLHRLKEWPVMESLGLLNSRLCLITFMVLHITACASVFVQPHVGQFIWIQETNAHEKLHNPIYFT